MDNFAATAEGLVEPAGGLLRLPTHSAADPSEEAPSPWSGKTVLVTGAAGTVGQEIMAQLAHLPVSNVLAIDNDERATFFLEHQLQHIPHFGFALADICDLHSLTGLMEGVDIVIHAAALKHVTLCER